MNIDEFEGHTPGPWKAHNDFYKNDIDESNLGEVTSFRRTWGVTLSEERLDDYRENRIGHHVMHIADAKLIAAAPDLLAEVKRLNAIINKFDEYMCNNSDFEEAHALWLWNKLLHYNRVWPKLLAEVEQLQATTELIE